MNVTELPFADAANALLSDNADVEGNLEYEKDALAALLAPSVTSSEDVQESIARLERLETIQVRFRLVCNALVGTEVPVWSVHALTGRWLRGEAWNVQCG